MKNLTRYVCGFLFNPDLTQILLIKKNRPAWQVGKLNGVGGHIEDNETYCAAMEREFKEETSLTVQNWSALVKMEAVSIDEAWIVWFLYKVSPEPFNELWIKNAPTDEELVICDVDSLPDNVVPNIRWLIPMALDENLIKPVICIFKEQE